MMSYSPLCALIGSTAELEKMLDDFHDKVKEREMALKEVNLIINILRYSK